MPIIIGVNIPTGILFFYVNTPDDMAREKSWAKRT